MKRGLSQFGSELASIVRNRKVLIPVIAVLMVPVLYTAMFLGAFWDPYDRLEDLPVAIVNADKGAEFNGKTLHIGEEFVDKLKENPQFNWDFVTEAEAKAGMDDKTYYMTIEIPEDFSEKTTTLTSDAPAPARFTYMPNESFNFLASQIGNTAVEKMKESLNKEITEVYVRTVFDQMEQLADGIGKASDGAGKLAEGTSKVKDGAGQLEQNLGKLVSGSLSLKDGVAKLEAGGSKLQQGATALSGGASKLASGLAALHKAEQELSAGVTALGTGADALQAGSHNLSNGLSQLSQGSGTLADNTLQAEQAAGKIAAGLQQSQAGGVKLEQGAAQLVQGLEVLASKNAELAQDQGFQGLIAGSKSLAAGLASSNEAQKQLSAGASGLHAGLGKLKAGLDTFDGKLKEAAAGGQQLAAGGKKLSDGAKKAADGMEQFGTKLAEAADGSKALSAGAATVSGGATQLHRGLSLLQSNVNPFIDGSSKLQDGAQKLNTALLQLDDGSKELSGKLSDATAKTSGLHASDSMFEMFAGPVEADVQKVNEVPNYGTGFAPYFLSLGLFVGALVMTIVYSVREPAVRPASGLSWFWSKALTLVIAGTIQALIADAALLMILDLEVKSIPLFMLFSILTSITFMMLIQFLVTTMQNPGRFLAIVLLIFQLTSSAGTFPLELIPNWLQKVTPWLPMTYSVAGLKDVISSGDYSSMWRHAAVLGGFALVFALITMIYFAAVHHKQKAQGSETAVAAS
ncbi:YhgE/Pip domain-containing protein [Paenibacillus oenotherae]|uniref:YhgE/Pip domain-containing protein n=1 Tax=Paenibacillus oenotherae TaxID=1435645 RepID=A0ABS7D8F1_9BACL|nr:YhgE/Pip domain-containing protein [Paenibacillus oenotherae]MBW7475812.1 YhgE/Pip domain-containing protein [Paenibacillus oenotherae]